MNKVEILEKLKDIEWQDFEKIELRVGKILSAEIFKEARVAAYILHVDFGKKIGVKDGFRALWVIVKYNKLTK